MPKILLTTAFWGLFLSGLMAQNANFPFRNTALPAETRVDDLLHQLTLTEKIAMLGNDVKPIDRLALPAYNWWSEALHGVARAGEATIFPQAIGMAASFNAPLMQEVASAISTEARAKYNLAAAQNRHTMYTGLTFWSPNVNIFRDPRWGRGQETYGEDPYLTGTMGVAFVQGMQGNDPLHLKTSACAKHFAVHSGPEKGRHSFNVLINEKDLRETYLYAFHKLVDAHVESVMCAYNRVNNEPCCTSNALLHNILKNEWHFNGHIVTDCGALYDILDYHKTWDSGVKIAAEAIKSGINVECGGLMQRDAMAAIEQHLISEKDIDNALRPGLLTQVKLGMFDPSMPYSQYGRDSIANDYHVALSRKMAQQSMVLLKNSNHLLPLDQQRYHQYMLIGPNAASLDALVGNYHGTSSNAVTFVDGITRALGPEARIEYDMGCDYQDTTRFGGIWAASNAEVTICMLGLTPVYEGEEGDAFLAESGADRARLGLPLAHIAFLKKLRNGTKTPIVLVITAGSAIDIAEVAPYADAILLAWYPGQQGGNALADILFGKVSPSGHLPVTFYNSLNDLPDYASYDMKGRTYRYFKGKVQYPFGFGMSYTTFRYGWAKQPTAGKTEVNFSVKLNNTGQFAGDEVVQAYIHYPDREGLPVKELKSFKRVALGIGEEQTVQFSIPLSELQKWENGAWKIVPGTYTIVVGSNADDEQLSGTIRL